MGRGRPQLRRSVGLRPCFDPRTGAVVAERARQLCAVPVTRNPLLERPKPFKRGERKTVTRRASRTLRRPQASAPAQRGGLETVGSKTRGHVKHISVPGRACGMTIRREARCASRLGSVGSATLNEPRDPARAVAAGVGPSRCDDRARSDDHAPERKEPTAIRSPWLGLGKPTATPSRCMQARHSTHNVGIRHLPAGGD